MITIFTPTYNRAFIISKLYQSLCQQTTNDFEWLIVDDGSSDNTEDVIKSFQKEKKIQIRFFKQENRGKHAAINKGIELTSSELFFIVDSDDYLTPDAINTIISDWKRIKKDNICGISYLRGYGNGEVIGSPFPKNNCVENYISLRINKGVLGDKAEVWDIKKLREYRFPVFPGEKFIGEGYIWYQLGLKYDMLFVNRIIYICDYLGGGLTKSGKKMRIQNPLGGMAVSLVQMNPKSKFSYRIKKGILYIAYSFFAGKNLNDILTNPYKLLKFTCLPFGWCLYHYWKKKYGYNKI